MRRWWEEPGSHTRSFNKNLVTSVENGYLGYKVLITVVASASISYNIIVFHVLVKKICLKIVALDGVSLR